MFTNRKMNLFLIGTLIIGLIVVLALSVAPSAAATTTNSVVYADYAGRHPGISNPAIEKALGSDYFQRQKEMGNVADAKALSLTGSDFYERQAGLGNVAVAKVLNLTGSDYYERQVGMGNLTVNQMALGSIAADLAANDFYTRHPELAGSAVDMSDYSLRHSDNKTLGSDWFELH
jgi:hypothetical protein